MPNRDPSTRVPLEVGPDTYIRIGWISAILGFTIAIVSAIGELLGWWDLLGEIGMTVGSMLGIVATLGTLSFTASREQATAIRDGIENVGKAVNANGETLGAIDDDLDEVQAELDKQTGVLERQVTVLEELRDAA